MRRHLAFGAALSTLAIGAYVSFRDAPPVHAEKLAPPPPAGTARSAKASAPEKGPPACPAEMAPTGDACIDRWEASLERPVPGGAPAPFPPYKRPKSDRLVARSRPGGRPQAYVSRIEAASACENAGKRLCSVSEWYRACRGSADTLYPYGPAFLRGRCNVGRPHLLSILHGNDPKRWRYEEDFNDPALDQRPGFLAATGAFSGCVNDAGVFDLVGNLHEWVSDSVNRSLPGKLPLTPGIRARLHANQGKGIFMGGFFSTTDQHGEGCNFVTMAHEPGYHDYSTGFRCCRDL